ncbi:MAG TPA: transcription-repair coupling factor [Balneolaceae bacterium]|nr:transcription-repair coupling factor [Balneolaceae bacterium]
MSLSSIAKTFASSVPWKPIEKNIREKNTIQLDHFVGSTHSLFLSALSKRFDNIVAIFPDQEGARFLAGDLEALDTENNFLFPPSGLKPYDSQQITESALAIERSEVLEEIQQNDRSLTVTSVEALYEKIITPDAFSSASLQISTGDTIEPADLVEQLVDQQYSRVKFVDHRGEFARRGGILDVFPFSGDYPVRLEFFGDEIDSIREFDPDSQRSISYKKSVRFVPDVTRLNSGKHKQLLEYLDDDTVIVLFNASLIAAEFEKQFADAEEHFQNLDETDDIQPPEKRFVTPENFKKSIANRSIIGFGAFTSDIDPDWSFRLDASPQPDFNGSIKLLREDILSLSRQSFDTYLLCDNPGQQERFEELLGESSQRMRYHLSVETLHEGFILNEKGIAVYTDHQIFNRYHRPKIRRRKKSAGISFKELRDLSRGDYVVHVDYGIGVFQGFKKIKVRGTVQESVVLHYKEGSVLYVNVSSLHKIQKYSGKEGMQPRIDKLGSGRWARKKAETKKKVKDIARDLIKLYAKRKSQDAYRFNADNSWQVEMEARFEYEETPDQREAIEAVKEDMESNTPMDRLVCGDVGFGKTEVAVRAAFKAVMDHKQVAMLVPTTILAEQHYKTFSRRMKEFPVNIEMLSRFRSRSEQKKTLKKLSEGKVDVVIGTHRLASRDVNFKDLGLLIVDEEQRFGVKTKEKLKKYRATVDVLTLTATPIPRTLQFSLMGARDLSIITTPPPNRQPVQTEIHSMDEDLIRDAILQEVARGGQVFFIHNRVKNIEQMAAMIRRIIPDIRVRFAHGQMSSKKLEKLIEDFYDHKFDVLVSTNIVENGIDIPNANTMIINRADNFGLAELHQLRGRVGRSNRKAFCFLITPPIEKLTPEARKRLLALEEFSDLGAGFNIAMRDLDIRGAGDILGAEQSGFINDLGFELYKKILNDAVKELKQDEFDDVFEDVETSVELPETQVEMDWPALLENDYVSDNVERLNMYRKLAGASSEQEIDEWEEELEDRFGAIPQTARNLIFTAKVKLFASQNLFTKVTVRSDRMWLVCPKQESELGNEFYENKFQPLMKTLQQQAEDRLEVIQKDNRIRFVISDIPNLQAAADFLQSIRTAKPEGEEILV